KAPEMDLSYRSTISIYRSILEQFNPALESLVYLGNNYLRAFHALSKAAEVYFKAIEKIGEQALQSSTSHMLGEILMQMSNTQRVLSSDLEVVAQTFHVDLLQHMEKNTKMDVQFISKQYELEYQRRAANLDKCMAELWRMERARDKNVREMKENVMRLRSEMQAFVSESQREAELEEKRRYRFLAEKHQMLYNTLLQFYSRARAMIQTKAPQWKEQLEATRNPSNSHSQGLLGASHGQGYPSGRLTPTHLEMPQRPLGDFTSSMSGSRSSIFSPELPEMRLSPQPDSPRQPLRRTPSASLLPTGRASRSGSFGEARSSGSEGRRKSGMARVQAIVPHTTGVNRTLLRFDPGDVITVLMPEVQNGWLYGKLEGSSICGWFPEAYVKPLEDAREMEEPAISWSDSWSFPLRSSHSMDDILDRPSTPSSSNYWPATAQPHLPSPPPLSVGASSHQSGVPTPLSSGSKVSAGGVTFGGIFDQPPELFPRGTNPFATVKLRPTVTNDRSAPIIR
uniref:BAR/IMD domain containing adaptor protein 2 like 2 n=1 Tax=Amazona collaria TaxID=241587 RepID=A0A8B9FFH7_9PSIT